MRTTHAGNMRDRSGLALRTGRRDGLVAAVVAGSLATVALGAALLSCGSVAVRSTDAGGGAGGARVLAAGTAGAATGQDAGDDTPVVDDGGGVTCAPSKAFGTALLV